MESRPHASLAARIRATFLAPSKLPALIRSSTPWLDVLLLSTAVAIVSVATMPDEPFLEAMSDPVSRRGAPVEVVSSPEVVARWGRAMGMLATLATHPVLAFVVAGIALVLFVVLQSGSLNYRELLSLTSHAMLIPAVGTLIAIAVRVAAGADRAVATWYEPPENAGLLIRTLVAVDPFLLWMLVVLAIGVSGLDPKLPRGRSAALLIGGYLVLVVASTALLHPALRST